MNPGDTIGNYRIREPLGKGGMGEVFAAEDTRLHRRVALKILPQIFAADPAYRERFEHEARAVAALNHPNIVTIHSVEEDQGRLFITMELVDGQPLSEVIPKGGLPVERVLRIGMEVADAMAAAQARGITHRDLKPGNIMLAAGGRAKVLDFGLATIHDAANAPPSALVPLSNDETRMSPASGLTGEGKIIGTVSYMSPEQAEGKPVDPRSDIFSLGVVLYEMATGARPFKGDTNVSTIAAIIKDTPALVTDTNPELPADLARIIRRCLAKDPERRYQTAADLRNELEELKQDTGIRTVAIERPGRRRGSRLAWLAPALGGLAVAGVAVFILGGGWRGHDRPAPPGGSGTAPFTIDHFQRLTTTGTAFVAAISPDGRYVVHAKGEQGGVGLWTRQTAAASDVRIVPPGDVGFDGLAFSPDGNFIYYSVYTRGAGIASLYKIPVLGGTPTKVLDDIDSPVTFSPDQKQLAFIRGAIQRGTNELIVANVDGSQQRVLAAAPPPDLFQHRGPSWSPDGRTILTTATTPKAGVGNVVYAVNASSGATRVIPGGGWGFLRDVQWLPDGESFLASGIDFSGLATPQIWRIAFPSGERSRVTNDLNSYAGLSLSADGRSLATVQTETVAGIYLLDPRGGEPRRVTGGPGRIDGANGLSWLSDGRLVYASTASGLPQIWIVDGDGGNARQLTTLPGPAQLTATAPDGAWIYFTSYATEGVCLFRIAPDGSGLQQLTRDGNARQPIVSPDGKTLYFTATRGGQPRVMKVTAEGGTPVAMADAYFAAHDISPDGMRLLGTAWNDQMKRVVLAVYRVADGKIDQLPDYPTNARFMPDGGLGGVQRIQGQSVAGVWPVGKPFRPIAPPTPDIIYNGAISKTGGMAISRGQASSDVVVIIGK